MNPLSINPLHALAAVAGALLFGLATGFGAGWTANGWRLNAELADLKATHAGEQATQAAQTVSDMKRDADQIRQAATVFLTTQNTLGPKIDALKKEMKNAQPLPPDCRPDAFRVRNLEAAIDAANAAAATGRHPGNPLY